MRTYVQFRKFDGSRHHRIEAERVLEDHHGVWLRGRAGSRVWVMGERLTVERTGFVALVPHDGWWLAFWNTDKEQESAIYVDVTTPAEWVGDEVQLIDLDLDVVRRWDGTCAILDEDEFAEHAVAMRYPPDVVAAAEQTARRLLDALTLHRPPFAGPPAIPF